MTPQLILVAGPYRSGTSNVAAMPEASLQLFRAGHLPVMGEWFALPLIGHAGSERIGNAAFNEMVSPAHGQGKPVYFSLNEIPPC